jgi:hypothetical protein
MLTEKLLIVTRIYKQFDPSFSLICYYSFIFGLLRISIGLSVFGFVTNEELFSHFLLFVIFGQLFDELYRR